MKTKEQLLKEYRDLMERIKPFITANDRSSAMVKFNYSQSRVSVYINGLQRATNIDVYFNLISFFNQRIEKRSKVFQND